MRRLLKCLIFLLLMVGAVFLSRVPSYSHIVFPTCIGLSVLLIGATLVYLQFAKKKNILSCIAIILMTSLMLCSTGYAASGDEMDSSNRGEWKNFISQHKESICTAAKNKTSYDQRTYDTAEKIYSYAILLGEKDYSEAQDCAEKYLGKANKLKKQENKKCSPIASLIKSYLSKDSCWPCDITGLIISSIQRVAVASYGVVRTAALSTLGVLFLFWLAYVTLSYFGKFGFARVSEYLTNVLSKSVLVMIIAAFLHMPLINAYQFIISPFVQYASGMAISLSNHSRNEVHKTANMLTTIADLLSGEPDCDFCNRVGSTAVLSNQFLDAGTVNSILCSVCTVYKQVTPMISLGQALMCYSTSAPKSYHDTTSVSEQSSFAIPSLSSYFVGFMFVALFSLLMVIVGFHIMAATMKLGFVVVLMPMWLVFFVFKPTRVYTSKAWVLVVHSMVTFIALSIALAIILVGFNNILTDKVILGFALEALIKSPTEMMATFGGAFEGTDPLATDNGGKDESWASGFTESLISFAIGQFTDFHPGRTMILLASFAMLSISLIDKAAQYVERLTNAYIQLSSTDADKMFAGIGSVLTAAAVGGKAGGAIGSKLTEQVRAKTGGVAASDIGNEAAARARWEDEQRRKQQPTSATSPTRPTTPTAPTRPTASTMPTAPTEPPAP